MAKVDVGLQSTKGTQFDMLDCARARESIKFIALCTIRRYRYEMLPSVDVKLRITRVVTLSATGVEFLSEVTKQADKSGRVIDPLTLSARL